MKSIKYAFLSTLCLLFLASCSNGDDTDVDDEKPSISLAGGFPQSCTELKRGETYIFKANVSDNVGLSAYSLDLHHNFDHHTHDDQGSKCELSAKKTPDNPLIFMENYTLEPGKTSYEITIELTIPQDVDTGDYHCAYSVTDVTGWQGRTSVDVKVVE
ncbi:DUF4625 domain-containing protein [Zobellia galactanivorans]|uniref:DUF4625 domain-containing protein n=1 Tax=Zobellia galactanivorans (strain DSM 12802 / CCUG 47099 / CIP 106680 / NCIMB 13871 / Dsij) TaxID=63186 RepID=UPI001C07890A|nr:DUF4625 domain-containing protein [Zobellia galactanivorans]MBU3026249.1 DUF4625 domain-containing protein [Zobellia galactanivorans]